MDCFCKIPGTKEVYLVYDSSFADDSRSTLLIKLLPSRIPEEIRLVHLSVSVAGCYFRTVFSAVPNLTYTYSWKRTNVYNQTVNGLVNAKGKLIKLLFKLKGFREFCAFAIISRY